MCEKLHRREVNQSLKFEVSKRQIEFLCWLHFSKVRIAELLGISTKTLSRRRQEFQMNDEQNWTASKDGELREIMQTRMLGALYSRGI